MFLYILGKTIICNLKGIVTLLHNVNHNVTILIFLFFVVLFIILISFYNYYNYILFLAE